ncbi:membrane protein [Dickeya fangzhongdai]|nr:membrane protein [Dickeya fangzhongdai]
MHTEEKKESNQALQSADTHNRENEEARALAEKVESTLIENPIFLERLLDRPQIKAMVSSTFFRGPLPPPEMLREYNDIVPDGAERIMAKSEREQAHRHRITEKSLDGEMSRDKRGQWMAFAITMTILVIATLFAWKGEMVFAGTLITLDLIGLASVFVIGRYRPSNNSE